MKPTESTNDNPPENAGVPPVEPGNAGVPPAANKEIAGKMPAVPGEHKGWHSRGYLPHFVHAELVQSITFRLHDSVPSEVVERWREEIGWNEALSADHPAAVELRERIERYADEGHGMCYLRDERIARMVQEALLHFDGRRYRLLVWCIMPNHVHVLMETMEGHPLSAVVHSWKSFTAKEANRILNRGGSFWMEDYHDRFIRDASHMAKVREYIVQNPLKAGLVNTASDWKWTGN